MAGPMGVDKHTPPQSPRTKGIIQASVREVKMHMEGIDADVEVMWTSTSAIHPHLHIIRFLV
jgi:hypothetical protein